MNVAAEAVAVGSQRKGRMLSQSEDSFSVSVLEQGRNKVAAAKVAVVAVSQVSKE